MKNEVHLFLPNVSSTCFASEYLREFVKCQKNIIHLSQVGLSTSPPYYTSDLCVKQEIKYLQEQRKMRKYLASRDKPAGMCLRRSASLGKHQAPPYHEIFI